MATGGRSAGRRAPSLSGLDGWQQSPPRSLTQLRGKVVVVWFFSLSSAACVAMVPGLRTLQLDHDDVQIIGIHAPEFARDADPQKLGLAAARAGMTWPIAMDHRRTVFCRWQAGETQRGWPCTYILDRSGIVAAHHDGGDVTPVRRSVEALLAQPTAP